MSYSIQFGQVTHYIPYFLGGAWITLQISFLAFLVGSVVGLFGATGLTFGGPIWRSLVRAYQVFFTNTPGLVQIYFLFFALPEFGILLSSYQAVLLGITLNAGAYLTQIYRGGFLSIPKNELDAAESMGMSLFQIVRYVIVPHVIRVLYPALSNKFILMILGSAVGGVFGLEELTGRTINANSETFRAIELFSMAAVIYVALTLLSSIVLAAFGRFVLRVKIAIV